MSVTKVELIASDFEVHCPVCGRLIFEEEQKDITICEHVLFVTWSGDDFIYVAPSCKEVVAEVVETCEKIATLTDDTVVEPVKYALDRLTSDRKQRRAESILCFAMQLPPVGGGCDAGVLWIAVNFGPPEA